MTGIATSGIASAPTNKPNNGDSLQVMKVKVIEGNTLVAVSPVKSHITPKLPITEEMAELLRITKEERKARLIGEISIIASDVKNLDTIYCLINCESQWYVFAWNKDDPNDGSKGCLQFQDHTFLRFSKKVGEGLDIWNCLHQVKVADYMISIGRIGEWTCSKGCK